MSSLPPEQPPAGDKGPGGKTATWPRWTIWLGVGLLLSVLILPQMLRQDQS